MYILNIADAIRKILHSDTLFLKTNITEFYLKSSYYLMRL